MTTKILIEDIENEQNKTLAYEFEFYMEEFASDVFADLEFKSLGEFIEVTGNLSGKIKLTCDRCLNEFDYDLDINIQETYAKHSLQDEYSQEFELQRVKWRGVISVNNLALLRKYNRIEK